MTHSARTPVTSARRETRAGAKPGPTLAPAAPSNAEIARLAYGYWEARGRPHGSSQEDWFRAERELLRRQHASEFL